MTDHCSDCGAELMEGSKFCTACGKTVEQQPVTPVQPEPQQPVEKKQASKPPKTKKKPRKKLIMGLLAIVAIVVIIIIAIYLQGGTGSTNNADSMFVGEWNQYYKLDNYRWMFNMDGTFGITPPSNIMHNGSWTASGNQICFYNMVCYSYIFSDDSNILILTRIGQNDNYFPIINLTKKELQGTSQTPDIACSSDSATNRIIIESIDANVKWSDIEITTNNANATWQVQDSTNKGLARIGITSTISVYVSPGDSIFVLQPTGEVTLSLMFKPTNDILGHWTVNV